MASRVCASVSRRISIAAEPRRRPCSINYQSPSPSARFAPTFAGRVLRARLRLAGCGSGWRAVRGRLPTWAARTLLGVGLIAAVGAAVLIHLVTVAAPLFAQPSQLPSVADSAKRLRGAHPVAELSQNRICWFQ
jgi:hypothetical protein